MMVWGRRLKTCTAPGSTNGGWPRQPHELRTARWPTTPTCGGGRWRGALVDARTAATSTLTSSEFASAMNWRLTLPPENANCSAYLTQPATPGDEAYLAGNVSDGTAPSAPTCAAATGAGQEDECCHAFGRATTRREPCVVPEARTGEAPTRRTRRSRSSWARASLHPHATAGDFNADAYSGRDRRQPAVRINGRVVRHAAGAEIDTARGVQDGLCGRSTTTPAWRPFHFPTRSSTTRIGRGVPPSSTAPQTRRTEATRAASGSGRWARRWRLARRR